MHDIIQCTVVSATFKYDESDLPESENVARGRSPSATFSTKVWLSYDNYELRRWLVETPLRDIRHYRMLNIFECWTKLYQDNKGIRRQ